jgi:hypothetical protein
MSLDAILITVIIIAVVIAAAAGAFSFFRSPGAYITIGGAVWQKLTPIIFAYITKRMKPEEEAAWRKCQLRGGKWNHRTRRCE